MKFTNKMLFFYDGNGDGGVVASVIINHGMFFLGFWLKKFHFGM